MDDPGIQVSRKAVLVVLFVPSVERDGRTAINQDYWVDAALETFGILFGGATAFPRPRESGATMRWVACSSTMSPS